MERKSVYVRLSACDDSIEMNNTAYIALGSNLPHAGEAGPALLARAASALKSAGHVPRAFSGVWQTAAWPPSDQPDYFNAVIEVDAGEADAPAVYETLRAIEMQFGRDRREIWAARTLDLDIVVMDNLVGEFDGIVLPHPRMHERAFVLAPMAEIAPYWRHPLLKKTAADLLAGLPVDYRYRRISDFPVLAG
jgi:2-amino-4-hydroxy-6-hydroxymethyldihydropteridine diphosphokinase